MTDDTRVLKFRVGDEYYCVSISEITEVEEEGELRTVPSAPDFSMGVRDYRETVLEVLDPQEAFDIRGARDGENLVIVLHPDYNQNNRYLGWAVDEVYDVATVSPDEIDESVEGDGVNGSIQDANDGMMIWLDPKRLFGDLDYDVQ